MKTKTVLLLVSAVLLAGLAVQPAMALRPGGLTMLVVPARYSVMQVAMDIVQRYAAVIVSYQGDASSERPLLHAWNGEEWVKVSMEDYGSGNFLQMVPSRAILVGDASLLPPVLASSIASWCPDVTTVTSLDTAALVNEFAKIFAFRSADWDWFSGRYNLTLQDENAELRKTSWYDQPSYEDEYTPRLKRRGAGYHDAAPVAVAQPEPEPAPVAAPEEAPVAVEKPRPRGADAAVEREPRVVVPSVGEPTMPGPDEQPIIQSPSGIVTERNAAAPAGWEEKAVETEAPVK